MSFTDINHLSISLSFSYWNITDCNIIICNLLFFVPFSFVLMTFTVKGIISLAVDIRNIFFKF